MMFSEPSYLQAREIQKKSTYIELKKHAHWIMGEPGWEEAAKLIHDWLKRLS
jgi:hypothetical protein